MRIEVHINVPHERAPELAKLYDRDLRGGSWAFDPEDRSNVLHAMAFLEKNRLLDEPPYYMLVWFVGMEDVETANLRAYPHLEFATIATRIVSRKTRMPGEWHDVVTCPDCGNEYADPKYEVPFGMWKPKKKYSLFAVDVSQNLYAHKRHIAIHEEAGLTGLSFEETDVKDLYRVRIAPHKWQDREGLCETCGMKTNVVGGSHFNAQEKYLYDYQYIIDNQPREDPQPTFILSQKAFWFTVDMLGLNLEHHKEFGVPIASPIMPGHLSHLIAAPKGMYRNGQYPTSFLRD